MCTKLSSTNLIPTNVFMLLVIRSGDGITFSFMYGITRFHRRNTVYNRLTGEVKKHVYKKKINK